MPGYRDYYPDPWKLYSGAAHPSKTRGDWKEECDENLWLIREVMLAIGLLAELLVGVD